MEYHHEDFSSMGTPDAACEQTPMGHVSGRTGLGTQLLALGLSLMTSISGIQVRCQNCGISCQVQGGRDEMEMIEEILSDHDHKSPRCSQPRMRHNTSTQPRSERGIGLVGNSRLHDLKTDAGAMDVDVVTDCAMYSPPSGRSTTPPKKNHRVGYHPNNALYPAFANRIQRVESLWDCSRIMGFSRDEAAEAGFVHLPEQKMQHVVCFYCGVEIKLLRHDDAWIEHAQANPFCEFVKRDKGDDFINMVTDIRDEESAATPSFLVPQTTPTNSPSPVFAQPQQQLFAQPARQQVNTVDRQTIQARLDRDECQLLVRRGFSRQLIGQVIAEQLIHNGDDFKCFMDMFKAVEAASSALHIK